MTTFRFFVWNDKPIVADLTIDQYADMLQAAFCLCYVDEKNAMRLVGLTYPSGINDKTRLTANESEQLIFKDPSSLLHDYLPTLEPNGQVLINGISREFAYPRGEDSWDIWFHDIGHFGRQAVIHLSVENVAEVSDATIAFNLGNTTKIFEYSVLQPDGTFQKCIERAGVLGSRIEFALKLTMNQQAMEIEYPVVVEPSVKWVPKIITMEQNEGSAEPGADTVNLGSDQSKKSLEQTTVVPSLQSLMCTKKFVGGLV